MMSVLAVCIGASGGALLRWATGVALNSLFPAVPPGTLAVNLVGGYLIGLALAFFAHFPAVGEEWRLLIVTGFLGGLTTFSTFSAEVYVLIRENRLHWAALAVGLHVGGTLVMTFLGMETFELIR